MMNLNQLTDKISAKGYRRSTAPRKFYDEEGNEKRVYDFEHRKKLDMFSVYIDEYDMVDGIEFTKVTFDQATKRFSQQVTKINNVNELNKVLG